MERCKNRAKWVLYRTQHAAAWSYFPIRRDIDGQLYCERGRHIMNYIGNVCDDCLLKYIW